MQISSSLMGGEASLPAVRGRAAHNAYSEPAPVKIQEDKRTSFRVTNVKPIIDNPKGNLAISQYLENERNYFKQEVVAGVDIYV